MSGGETEPFSFEVRDKDCMIRRKLDINRVVRQNQGCHTFHACPLESGCQKDEEKERRQIS